MKLTTLLLLASTLAHAQQSRSEFLTTYKGHPYTDAHHPIGAQPIPGKVECAFYDTGGEAVAYHDTDAKNNGSGTLNPANGTYLNEELLAGPAPLHNGDRVRIGDSEFTYEEG